MASIPVDFIAGKISSLLENEISLLTGVRDELNAIKNEFGIMKAFLHDADRRKDLTEGQKTWMANVRDKAYDVEDIIDEFMYYMNKLPQGDQAFFAARFLHRTIRLPKTLWVRHQMGTKLQKIKNEIKSIRETHQRYGIDSLHGGGSSSSYDHNWVRNLGESSLFFRDDDLVGIENDRDLLLGWLKDRQQQQRTVISVFGMGGSGKTTLVANTYNFIKKKTQHFDSFAWVTVSQTFVIEELLRTMVKEFFKDTMESIPSDLSYRDLVETLVNYLEPKRYLLVLDDVWDINFWSQIKVALPDCVNGSRILLTTRNKDTATLPFGVGSHFHRVRPLAESEAWTLFCMKAFLNNPDRCCPSELENIAGEVVEKCEGLPLAIVTLGGVMSSKKSESEWRQICSSLNWELNNNPKLETVKSILWLSFNELPSQLKPCFLYCSAFPEDYPILRLRLIKLWMAEGFVEEVRGVTLEVVADNYLKDLICRSMIQVGEWDANGKPAVCKMHDLMRELALSTSTRENFCVAYDSQEARIGGGVRRLSIQSNYESCKNVRMSKNRSFLLFPTKIIYSSFSNILPPGIKLLRVLDLEGAPITRLPKEVVNLFNLRYLNLRGTDVEEIPRAIGRLGSLQTLDISETRVKTLPIGIVKLQNLRHLVLFHNFSRVISLAEFDKVSGTKIPQNIRKLKKLQVLYGVEVRGDLLKQVKNLTQLKSLGISKVRESDEMDMCNAIQELNVLQQLHVKVTDEDEYLRMDGMLSKMPPSLLILGLFGKLEKVPKWFPSLQNLTFLELHFSKLREDIVPNIQALPNLATLNLNKAFIGRQLCFRTGFHKLVTLEIINMPELNEIIIENGVMPSLEELNLRQCSELKTPPQGIEYLTTLQKLNLVDATCELVECICGELKVEGQNKWKIPNISSYQRTSTGRYNYERLS